MKLTLKSHSNTRQAATVKTVREGQALEEKCISLIEEQIVKPATNGTKQTQNSK